MLFKDRSTAWLVGLILVVNGFVLIVGDIMKRRAARANPATEPEHFAGAATPADMAMHAAFVGGTPDPAAVVSSHGKVAEDLTFPQAVAVGATQVAALLPGISRSGVTIIGGLLTGLTYEEASRYAFMLATPVIAAAACLKIPTLMKESHDVKMMALYGSGVAFVAAYLSIAFLMKYFHTNRLTPFGYFCILFGGFCAVWLKMHP